MHFDFLPSFEACSELKLNFNSSGYRKGGV
jgi:hypothetical protein